MKLTIEKVHLTLSVRLVVLPRSLVPVVNIAGEVIGPLSVLLAAHHLTDVLISVQISPFR